MSARAQISRIAIVGAGLMGHGIAQVFLTNPRYEVAIYDPVGAMLDSVRERILSNLDAIGQPPCNFSRLKLRSSLRDAVAGAQIIIEAAPEKVELKQEIFHQLEAVAPPDCILASNTSVIPISRIGEKLSSRGRLIATHWWSPPYLIPLVEVAPAPETGPDVISSCMELLGAVGKMPVRLKRDVPGFVANRLQHALWREAIAIVQAGICDAATVDLAVKNSFGLRLPFLGPLENADMVGLELTQDIHRVILADLDRSTEPSPLLSAMMAEGKLGMKSGCGFYRWSEQSSGQLRSRLLRQLVALVGKRDTTE